ncbi:MAG TPA: ribonuclease HII [Acidobacteriaceae bacterium]
MLRLLVCSDAPEEALRYHGAQRIAGVDEVGRGALFGPVVAAAVILPEDMHLLAEAGLKDSKQMLREDREHLDRMIREMALAVAVAEVDAETIDRINIYQASRLAMLIAVQQLHIAPDHLLIDAMRIDHPCAQTKLIYGDSLSLSIAAASVVAKVYRDAMMCAMDEQFPAYGLASHKGYGTPFHRRALAEFGPTPLHRKTFAPVAALQVEEAALELDFAEGDVLFDELAANPTHPISTPQPIPEEDPCRFD